MVKKLNRCFLLYFMLMGVGALAAPGVLGATENKTPAAAPPADAAVLAPGNSVTTRHTLTIDGDKIDYTAIAESITVKDDKAKPIGRIFYIAYTKNKPSSSRPLTFVFNGGPGAASAYLHMGALGPQRVAFNADGTVAPMPPRIEANPKSWLAFTDLVFVDPVGTGYSREIKPEGNRPPNKGDNGGPAAGAANAPEGRAWGVSEDTDSLARFIRAYLTRRQRWLSPVVLAGESYGGFRVARLSALLQTEFGIAPSGLVLISPVLDFGLLWGGKNSLWPWVALLPSYAAVASFHDRGETPLGAEADLRTALAGVEDFALSGFLHGLSTATLDQSWLDRTSRLTGMKTERLKRFSGRIPQGYFVKNLLADQHRILSLYDGSISMVDPDPAMPMLSGTPYLDRISAPITAAFNSYVRSDLHFETDLPYLLLNHNVYASWNWRSGIRGPQGYVETAVDLKKAMSLNPEMQILVVHGVFDLVTPYFASEILIRQMALDPAIGGNIRLRVHHGGHMPYLNLRSLAAMFEDAARFYRPVK